MKHEMQVELLKRMMRLQDDGKDVDAGVQYRVPADYYFSPEIAKKEWDLFFRNHPQMVGFSADLPEPRSYLTVDDFGVPVLMTRDSEGKVRAFLNACRHRGSRLANGRGKANSFACPFHAWTYSNRGDLIGVPLEDRFGAVDRSCFGLIELPAVELHGMLWVHPKPGGKIDLEAQLGADLLEELRTLEFGKLVHMGESLIKKDLNWKLAVDTFGETYHFARLHKNTLNNMFIGDCTDCRSYGCNHRMTLAQRRMDELRQKPEKEWTIAGHLMPIYFLFPNVLLLWQGTLNPFVKIYPDPTDPGRSITRVWYYTNQESLANLEEAKKSGTKILTKDNVYQANVEERPRVGELSAVIEIFDSTIQQEDYLMGEHQQNAVETGALMHVLFGRNEPTLHHYHRVFRDALNLPPPESVA